MRYVTESESKPVSRVLCSCAAVGIYAPVCGIHHTRRPHASHVGVAIIYLGALLPVCSSDLPERVTGSHVRAPIRSCSRWGLPSQPVSRLLVRSYRTVASLPDPFARPSAVYISVALSLGLLPPDVIRHPALWSSDFPPVRPFGTAPAIAQLTSRHEFSINEYISDWALDSTYKHFMFWNQS